MLDAYLIKNEKLEFKTTLIVSICCFATYWMNTYKNLTVIKVPEFKKYNFNLKSTCID